MKECSLCRRPRNLLVRWGSQQERGSQPAARPGSLRARAHRRLAAATLHPPPEGRPQCVALRACEQVPGRLDPDLAHGLRPLLARRQRGPSGRRVLAAPLQVRLPSNAGARSSLKVLQLKVLQRACFGKGGPAPAARGGRSALSPHTHIARAPTIGATQVRRPLEEPQSGRQRQGQGAKGGQHRQRRAAQQQRGSSRPKQQLTHAARGRPAAAAGTVSGG